MAKRRWLPAFVCLCLLISLPGTADGQGPPVMVRGMTLDSKEFQDSLSRPFWRAVASTPCTPVRWTPSFDSVAAFQSSVAPLVRRLRRDAGNIVPDGAGGVLNRRVIFTGPRYIVERIWMTSRIVNTTTTGYLARPMGLATPSAPVILMHGSGMVPAEAFGWLFTDQYAGSTRFANTAFSGAALELVEAGYTVFVPWFEDERDNEQWPLVQWRRLARNAASLSAKAGGVGAYYLLLNEVAGVIDFLETLPNVDMTKLSAIGWAEGAHIASAAAATDSRINAVVRLGAPLERRALRGTMAGVFGEAAFTHLDCVLGDVEMAAMVAPRPLLYAYSTADQSVSRFAGFISPRVLVSIRDMYSRLQRPENFAIMPDSTWAGAQLARMRLWLDTAVDFKPRPVPVRTTPIPASSERYRSQYMDSTEVQREEFIGRLGPCAVSSVKADYSSIDAFAASVEPLRQRLATSLRVPSLAAPSTFRILHRETVRLQAKYTLEYLELSTSRSTIPLTGFLATPITTAGQSMPAVISLDANYGLAAPFGLNGREPTQYLNAYADGLASNGVVVFAPWVPANFAEVAPPVLHAMNPDGPTSWSYMLPLYAAAIDFVQTVSGVDTKRLAVWGISYSAFSALYLTALDKRISALVYSNPVSTADILFGSADAAALAPWFGEMCSFIDPAMLYLIAPRKLIRENGLHDNNGYEFRPLETVDRIREVYARLGIPSQFEFYRHSGGHETLARQIF
ncbi:MAG: Alpha/beta hydrolase family protein [Gemmatimonadetes bacterium]|nr:Alpha/beta hydrolase family protein [Gemmatimonadota bacterium]